MLDGPRGVGLYIMSSPLGGPKHREKKTSYKPPVVPLMTNPRFF